MKNGAAWLSLATALLWSQQVLAETPPGFKGTIGKTIAESKPDMPPIPRAAPGSPNVLLWMIDDLGFAQLGSYGGLVDTPNLDRLAQRGLRYNNYHTQPICSASRAAILTGRNSHNVHIGGHSTFAIGYPGYDAHIPRSAGTIAENLRGAGYVTYALGKWDHLPSETTSADGPFTYWPSGQGFDRFYGFLSADADNFKPVLWSGNEAVKMPDRPDYHLSTDLADRAIEWIGSRGSAERSAPFFMYWATGAVHAPHHAPDSYFERYRGKFDMGWDKAREQIFARQKKLGIIPRNTKLPPRPDGMPAWSSLSADQKLIYTRSMEAFAAQLTHADEQFGRMLATLEARGELDNTMVIVTSDNGASAEGGQHGFFSEHYFANGNLATVEQNLQHIDRWGKLGTYNHYPMGWAVAGNTPFRYYKQVAFEGGVRVPLIISWPKGLPARGEIRTQFQHVIDVTPTILDAAGVKPSEIVNNEKQMPFDGISMKYTFQNPAAPTGHKSQYLEMYGNRAIWADGWKAVVPYRTKVWEAFSAPPFNDDSWELYNLDKDPNEMNNLAGSQPDRLKSMIAEFDRTARRYNIYPLHTMGNAHVDRQKLLAESYARRGYTWIYTQPITQVPEALAPPMQSRSFTLAAQLDLPEAASGVVMAMGGNTAGTSLYFKDGVPVFVFRGLDMALTRLAAPQALKAGPANIGVIFDRKDAGGTRAALTIDGKEVASGAVTGTLPARIFSLNETFDVGSDSGTNVSPDYSGPGSFTGKIRELRFETPHPAGDPKH